VLLELAVVVVEQAPVALLAVLVVLVEVVLGQREVKMMLLLVLLIQDLEVEVVLIVIQHLKYKVLMEVLV
jgi:ABC-type thiamin/hydroxymethylpyrimidine transport system permease subunit|tara:strand:+ start:590 stop:799 length:210 start_codon:yes stop_codon:yes gene_type:complete